MNESELKKLLTHTDMLMNHVFWVKQEFGLNPNKEHHGTCINYTDIKERKDDFLKELINTIADWVYSKPKARQIINSRMKETGSQSNASTFLTQNAFRKFRRGHSQGQFGELLLFNFIQHFFQAVPILRKMRITTSTGHERFGADAVHYSVENNNNKIYLGESKCYTSKYKFNEAFEDSLTSIVNTFKNFDKELDLYVIDDFIEEELRDVALKYKKGKLENTYFELVSLIVYHETEKINITNEKDIKNNIVNTIQRRCENIKSSIYEKIEAGYLSRINYIIFPVWEIDALVDDFSRTIGR
jgi:hypothetical protein